MGLLYLFSSEMTGENSSLQSYSSSNFFTNGLRLLFITAPLWRRFVNTAELSRRLTISVLGEVQSAS
jgi:hypothetical protein